jgi:hypothetical protein
MYLHTKGLANWLLPTTRPGFNQYVDLVFLATPLQEFSIYYTEKSE